MDCASGFSALGRPCGRLAKPMAVVTFTTDFGLSDAYVGAMKGVVLGVSPLATLVDVTHAIPAQDVRAGALVLADAAGYFPAGSVHVAVVDPGVGGDRQGIAVASRGHFFVGPDNGVCPWLRPSPAGRSCSRALCFDAEPCRRPFTAAMSSRLRPDSSPLGTPSKKPDGSSMPWSRCPCRRCRTWVTTAEAKSSTWTTSATSSHRSPRPRWKDDGTWCATGVASSSTLVGRFLTWAAAPWFSTLAALAASRLPYGTDRQRC